MKVLYKWTKKHSPKISPNVYYRYVIYDDEGGKDYTIECITLQYKYSSGYWTHKTDYSGYAEILNLLRLIEHATGKKIKGSYT